MKGTEKQIKWAEDIKTEMVEQMDAFISQKKLADEAIPERIVKQRAEIVALFDSVDDAAWWIENAADSHWQWVAKEIKNSQ